MKKFIATLLGLIFVFLNTTIQVFASTDYPHYVSGSANSQDFVCLINDGSYQNVTITFDQPIDSGGNPRYNQSTTVTGFSNTSPIDFRNDGSTVWSTPNSFTAPVEVGGLNGSNFLPPGYYSVWFNWGSSGIAAPFQVVNHLSQCANPFITPTPTPTPVPMDPLEEDGTFTAFNYSFNPDTNNLQFTAANFNPPRTLGIQDINDFSISSYNAAGIFVLDYLNYSIEPCNEGVLFNLLNNFGNEVCYNTFWHADLPANNSPVYLRISQSGTGSYRSQPIPANQLLTDFPNPTGTPSTDGTFTASNYSFDQETNILSFTADNFDPPRSGGTDAVNDFSIALYNGEGEGQLVLDYFNYSIAPCNEGTLPNLTTVFEHEICFNPVWHADLPTNNTLVNIRVSNGSSGSYRSQPIPVNRLLNPNLPPAPPPSTDYPHYVSGSANSQDFVCLINDGSYQNVTVAFNQPVNDFSNPRYNQSTTVTGFSNTSPIDFRNDGSTVWATFNEFNAPVEVGGLNGSNLLAPGYYSMWFNWNETGMAAPFQVVTNLSQCSNPLVTSTPDPYYIYVGNQGNGNVSVLDSTTNTVSGVIPVGKEHYQLAVSPDGLRVYTPNVFDSSVSVADTTTNSVIVTIPVGSTPTVVFMHPSGSRIYVLVSGETKIKVFNTQTYVLEAEIEGIVNAGTGRMSLDGSRLYISNQFQDSIFVIDTSSNTVIDTITGIGPQPGQIAISPDGDKLYVSTQNGLTVVDISTHSIIATFSEITNGTHAVTPDGDRVYANLSGTGVVKVVDTQTNTIIDTIDVGSNTLHTVVGLDGSRVYVTDYSEGKVYVIDTTNNSVLTSVSVGGNPGAMAIGIVPPPSTPTPTPTNTPTPTPTPTNAPPQVEPIADEEINQDDTYAATGSFTDPDSTSWTATVDYGDGQEPLTLNPDKTFNLSHQYTTSGSYTVTVVVTDDEFATGTTMATITVNAPPQIEGLSDAEINYQDDFVESGSVTDPDSTSWTGTVDYGDNSGIQNLTFNDNNFLLNHIYFATGEYTVTVEVTDNQGASDTETITVKVNGPPHVIQLLGATITEGDTYTENGSFSDPDSTSWTATVDYDEGAGVQSLPLSGNTFSLTNLYEQNGTYDVEVSITDNQGLTDTETVSVTVNNGDPTVEAITAPTAPVVVGSSIIASTTFSDAGVLDTHTVEINWGDGSLPTECPPNTTNCTLSESNGSGTVSANHIYSTAGVYEINITVTDSDGGEGQAPPYQYLSVYNPTPQGLFTGVRIFTSPLGAIPTQPTVTGQVLFGVTAKYQNGDIIGDVEMNFNAGDIEFESTDLTVFVTAIGEATLRGTGTVNGSGSYTFLVTGLDGGSGEDDFVRFKIKQGTTTIYDSGLGAADTADPTSLVTAGQVIIH